MEGCDKNRFVRTTIESLRSVSTAAVACAFPALGDEKIPKKPIEKLSYRMALTVFSITETNVCFG